MSQEQGQMVHSGDEERADPQRVALAPRRGRYGNALLLAGSLIVSLLFIELGFRVAFGLPVLSLEDWRRERVVYNRLGERGELDPVVGWTLKPNHHGDGHNTLDYGIRRNGNETAIRTGEILAVGDSFTEGWEVDDDDSWPAYLELMSGTPVVNAGVGGYGTDQIVLRTEQLLPIVQPKTLIVGFLHFDIYRTAHTHFGAPKPWFTVENGELRYHPPAPVEPPQAPNLATRLLDGLRDALSRSAAADYLIARLAPNYWYGSGGKREYIKANNDPVQVTCLLLERLKTKLDERKIRSILFMQYYAPVILQNEQPPADALQVEACASRLGFEIVDQFASLKALTRNNPTALRELYMVYGETYTHMNGEGNEAAADLLLKTLRQ
jgi:hypothetical protein